MKEINIHIPKGAIFSDNGKYRYALWRIWNPTKTFRLQIGLNPSKANAKIDDPTITRGVKRAYLDGFGGFFQANLYGYVSTVPDILSGEGFIGTDNDTYLRQMISLANGKVLCAWGSFPVIGIGKRADEVLAMIPEPYCLGINKDGQPKHPLYIRYNVPVKRLIRVMKGYLPKVMSKEEELISLPPEFGSDKDLDEAVKRLMNTEQTIREDERERIGKALYTAWNKFAPEKYGTDSARELPDWVRKALSKGRK